MGQVRLSGSLAVPDAASGVVFVIVRSATERRAPAPVHLADYLHAFGLATVLMALETEAELLGGVDLEHHAGRIAAALAWSEQRQPLDTLPVGLLAVGEASAAALLASARHADRVSATVCVGGCPALTETTLGGVVAPTLLVTGEGATRSLDAFREVIRSLSGHSEIAVVEQSDDLLADEAAFGTLCNLARAWFIAHLTAAVH